MTKSAQILDSWEDGAFDIDSIDNMIEALMEEDDDETEEE